MKFKLVGILILMMSLFISPLTSAQELETSKQQSSLIENKEVKVTGSINKTKLASLIPNYEKDYEDLLQQMMSIDNSYQEIVTEYNSANISTVRAKELEFLLLSKETNFKTTATELLSTRYTEDKTEIRPEIVESLTKSDYTINTSNYSTNSYDVIVYPDDYTEYTGNYGSTSGVMASYNSDYNNNTSKVYTYNTSQFGYSSSTVLHGWKFVPIIEYPYLNIPVYEFDFRYVEGDYRVLCFNNGQATLEISAEIYDATSNSFIGSHSLGQWGCLDGGDEDVNLDPTKVTFSYIGFFDNHTYTAYIKTHAMSTLGVVDGESQNYNATKWRYIEVDFD